MLHCTFYRKPELEHVEAKHCLSLEAWFYLDLARVSLSQTTGARVSPSWPSSCLDTERRKSNGQRMRSVITAGAPDAHPFGETRRPKRTSSTAAPAGCWGGTQAGSDLVWCPLYREDGYKKPPCAPLFLLQVPPVAKRASLWPSKTVGSQRISKPGDLVLQSAPF